MFIIEKENLYQLFPLLQSGFMVEATEGVPIREFLLEGYGIPGQYITSRIQTVFLDGSPVDDIDMAVLGQGAVLALSAAMPGLAGAVLRSGSPLASFRSTISHRGGHAGHSSCRCLIRVKLFNLLIGELGPCFLEKGVWLERETLASLHVREVEEDERIPCGVMNLSGKDLACVRLARVGAFPPAPFGA